MDTPIRVRFVGGPKHNELLCLNKLNNYLDFIEAPQIKVEVLPALGPIPYEYKAFIKHTYILLNFVTGRGTPYCQYVHYGWMLKKANGEMYPPGCSYSERFPRLTDKISEECRFSITIANYCSKEK